MFSHMMVMESVTGRWLWSATVRSVCISKPALTPCGQYGRFAVKIERFP